MVSAKEQRPRARETAELDDSADFRRARVAAQTLSRHERAAVVPPSTAFSVICLAALHICTYIRITRRFPAPTGRATQKLERLPGNLKLQNAFRQVLWQDDG